MLEELTPKQMFLNLIDLSLEINEQTDHCVSVALYGKKNSFELMVYANKEASSKIVTYRKSCRKDDLPNRYGEVKKRLSKMLIDSEHKKRP